MEEAEGVGRGCLSDPRPGRAALEGTERDVRVRGSTAADGRDEEEVEETDKTDETDEMEEATEEIEEDRLARWAGWVALPPPPPTPSSWKSSLSTRLARRVMSEGFVGLATAPSVPEDISDICHRKNRDMS
jgi:hypothetical protein